MSYVKVVEGAVEGVLVFQYDEGWLDFCVVSDLSNQVVIGAEQIPELIKELKKFKKRSDKELL